MDHPPAIPPDEQPRCPTAVLMEAAALLEDEARAIFESNTTFTTEHIVWDPAADNLRARHARLLGVAAELRVMAKGAA